MYASAQVREASSGKSNEAPKKECKPPQTRSSKKAAAAAAPEDAIPKLPGKTKVNVPAPSTKTPPAPPKPAAVEQELSDAPAAHVEDAVAPEKLSRHQKRKQKALRKKKRDVQKMSSLIIAKAEATAQDYANLTEKLATVLGKMTVKAKDNAAKISFDTFPWVIEEKTKRVLQLSSHRYLTAAPRPLVATKAPVVGESTTPSGTSPRAPLSSADSQFNAATAWRDAVGILLRGSSDEVSGIYMRDLARVIAAQYKFVPGTAKFFPLKQL